MKHYNAGFTLAEVLITLGIIGIVSAITIPTLINNFKMKSYETAFKKEYSAIQNVLNYLSVEENLTECYVLMAYNTAGGYYSSSSNDCVAVHDGLIERLKMTPISSFTDYAKRDYVLANGGSAINRSVYYDGLLTDSSSYMLPDGAIVTFSDKIGHHYYETAMLLDVNAKKGPNKWGYDVFYLTLSQHSGSKNLRLGDEWASIIEKGGKYPRTILKNSDTNTGGSYWN